MEKKALNTLIGMALKIGVLVSFTLILTGGIAYLIGHGQHSGNFATFKDYTLPMKDMLTGAIAFQPKPLIQLGIVILIGTPIMRVIFSAFSFALEKDYLYTTLTIIVLLIITLSMVTGYAG